jgi:hypothetical protein
MTKYWSNNRNGIKNSILDTRYKDLYFLDRDFVPYCQLIEQNDPLWTQFSTSFVDFTINLVDSNWNKTALSYSPLPSYVNQDGVTIYRYSFDVNVSSLTGIYYIEAIFREDSKQTVYWSEEFDVQEEHENTLLLKCGGNTTMNDGMYWASTAYEIDRYQQFRIEARTIEGIYKSIKSTYDDSDIELTTLSADLTGIYTLDIKEIPFYLDEKINCYLGHDEFYINEQLFNIEEDYELTSFKEQLMRTGNIQFRKVVYENYNNWVEQEGDDIVIPEGSLLINDTDLLIINASGDELKINN